MRSTHVWSEMEIIVSYFDTHCGKYSPPPIATAIVNRRTVIGTFLWLSFSEFVLFLFFRFYDEIDDWKS